MSTPKASKSHLFLLELIFMIFFFAVSGAVCVQIFVKAHMLSQDSTQLTSAVNLAQSTASILDSTDFTPDSLKEQWPEGTVENTSFYLYLDSEWSNCKEAQGDYLLTVEFSQNILTEAHITVVRVINKFPIYELEIDHYEEAAYET